MQSDISQTMARSVLFHNANIDRALLASLLCQNAVNLANSKSSNILPFWLKITDKIHTSQKPACRLILITKRISAKGIFIA
jgi:hypothetical protein